MTAIFWTIAAIGFVAVGLLLHLERQKQRMIDFRISQLRRKQRLWRRLE